MKDLCLDDSELLERCLSGDRGALEELAQRCFLRVRRMVLYMAGPKDDAEDMVQNAMIDIFTGLKGFKRRAAFTTWVDRITVHAVRRYYSRHPFRGIFNYDTEILNEIPIPKNEQPESLYESQMLFREIKQLLCRIKPDKRTAVVLSAAYGYSVTEIAELTECSVETAKKRLQRGQAELIEKMRKSEKVRQHLEGVA